MKRVGPIRDWLDTQRFRLLVWLAQGELRMRAEHWAWRCKNPGKPDRVAAILKDLEHLGPLMAKRSLANDLGLTKDIWPNG